MSGIVILYDPSFPSTGSLPGPDGARRLMEMGSVTDAAGLADALRTAGAGCFVNLHAPYFPKSAWTDILRYLERGNGLLSMGGAPFRIPVYEEDGLWKQEPEQPAYHQYLRIHEAMPVQKTPIAHLEASRDIPVCLPYIDLLSIEQTYSLVLHVTRQSDVPLEMGSGGPMDAHFYPLVKGISRAGREVAAPVVLLENTKGTFSGSRWMFVNQSIQDMFWSGDGVEAIQAWAAFCISGVTETWLKPDYACIEPGEEPRLRIQLQQLTAAREDGVRSRMWNGDISLSSRGNGWHVQETERVNDSSASMSFASQDDRQTVLWNDTLTLDASRELSLYPIRIPIRLKPGMYDIVLTLTADDGERRVLHQGIWCRDEELLQSGEPLRVDRDYFRKNGKPLPIVGMTYMTSDVARKYLFLPNVHVWDRDMATMKKAGINLIRTGIWTSYRHIMYTDGHASEDVMRAIDAFLLTAKRHDLEVTFNFFSFAPEMWEGLNPYLDPRSVEAQKRFIASIVSRHRATTHVHWDLINEPSLFDAERIFSRGPRTATDSYEQKAFREWIQQHHGSICDVQRKWGMTPAELPDFSAVMPPEAEEINFDIQDMRFPKRGTRWLDYVLFSMDMHNRWASELSDTIRTLAPDRLITVGQDEALESQRPSPFFYEAAVDYTTNHSWWLMDQLVWDGIFAKTPRKPNVIQETGIMYVETPDGRAKRSEEELRNILERKYAYAFSTGGAGAVQWLWNTNFYMHNVNESNIGALRADGTEKPEADVSYDFGAFMGKIGELFEDRELEDIVVVYPYSNDFSNRSLAVESTSRLTRVLTYELNTHFRALGEYQLDALEDGGAKLIIVPSAHTISDAAVDILTRHVRQHGGMLLITGPLGLDEYWYAAPERLSAETGTRQSGNVLREEMLELDGRRLPLSYGSRKIAQLVKEAPAVPGRATLKGAVPLVEAPLGQGRLLWTGLPIELNDRTESIADFYRSIFSKADIRPELNWLDGGDLAGVYGRKLQFREGALFIFVSEYAADASIRVQDPVNGKVYSFELESERTVMFATDRDGSVTAVYRPEQVSIDCTQA